jgi:hypothetical protein
VYIQYLSIYQYKEVSNEKLLDSAKSIYESFGESTQEAASNIHFHLGVWEDE